MALSLLPGLGITFQSIFVGGNLVTSALFVPALRNTNIPPSNQIKLWEKMFIGGAKLMAPCAIFSAASYIYLGCNASNSFEQTSMFISAGFSFSVILFTTIVMRSNIRYIQGLVGLSDEDLESKDYGSAINKWNKLSISRCLLLSLGLVNMLWYQYKSS
ncbi:hypothetical protein DASC09_039330 [Saccharomycopsis crataegensis]|uniref:DUF1772-domain-containing protein n=1 Tax=Saccharomycopsis crataegensis TaxID=43959 RepID=A0AAV5QP85_9ASCO|nr:hypothetical protein DASC09_039330 [Saccharomycopsis crataegensis]